MAGERIEVRRVVGAGRPTIFEVLCDPSGHVAIDSSGMLMSSAAGPVHAPGDSFVVEMNREALGDRPMGDYRVVVTIVTFRPDREIAWKVAGERRPSAGHVFGYVLEDVDSGTAVTSYYDWSAVDAVVKQAGIFPVLSEGTLRATLRATLGILARTVEHRPRPR